MKNKTNKDIEKMSGKERMEKFKDLKMELVRANVSANRTSSKTKELKRAISRLLTMRINKTSKEGELKKTK